MTTDRTPLSWSAQLQRDPRYRLIASVGQVLGAPFFIVVGVALSIRSPWWHMLTVAAIALLAWGVMGVWRYRNAFTFGRPTGTDRPLA
ncbi:hypothetical protein [Agromyces sp. ZXT2-6]|uniref:hypothetical protein n=1 Tax=Agromyces sp. ZXT2-6 TaxID=3461153 RepID=UPI004054D9F0